VTVAAVDASADIVGSPEAAGGAGGTPRFRAFDALLSNQEGGHPVGDLTVMAMDGHPTVPAKCRHGTPTADAKPAVVMAYGRGLKGQRCE